MSTAPAAEASPGKGARPGGGAPAARTGFLGDRRVWVRLFFLILLPTAVAVALGSFGLVTSLSGAADAQRIRAMAELSRRVVDLSQRLGTERDLAAWYVAGGRRGQPETAMDGAISASNTALNETRTWLDLALAQQNDADVIDYLQRVRQRLNGIEGLRDSARKTKIRPLPLVEKYGEIISLVLGIHDQTAQGAQDEAFSSQASGLAALGRAKEEQSKLRGALTSTLASGSFDSGGVELVGRAKARRESELAVFRAQASFDQVQYFDGTATGGSVDKAELTASKAESQAATGSGRIKIKGGRNKDATDWFESSGDTFDRLNAVERYVADALIRRSEADLTEAWVGAGLYSAVMVVLLGLVLLFTSYIARSLTRPLRRLRGEALDIAGTRLPATVMALSTSSSPDKGTVQPIGVHSRDEIGEVARAFDEVHREAVRLAAQEAQLRSNVNAMFVNLSRRSQTLVERQLRIIDGLEQGEQDAKRLEDFFKLDHLATRMRRNSENLLVLAGQDQPRRWGQPVPLVDVLRAAVSEVEQYQRISMRLQPGIAIAGSAVNDIVHLVAELTENATTHSPEDTPVVIAAHPLGGSAGEVMISITDSGIGMIQEELGDANRRLSESHQIDVSVSRRMGLFVVSRLSSRHGIRVQLRPSQITGITALILLPASIVTLGAAEPSASPMVDDVPRPALAPPPPAPYTQTSSPPISGYVQAPPPSAQRWEATRENGGFAGTTTAPPSAGPAVPSPARPGAPGPLAPPVNSDRLPIFDSVESKWFRRTPSGESPMAGADRSWSSPADAGWSTAQAASTPQGGGQTMAGLPKRVPKANLVPGSVTPAPAPDRAEGAGRQAQPDASGPPVTPDVVRTRLSGLQRGVRRARGEMDADPASIDHKRPHR